MPTVTGPDFLLARYYNSTTGRFLTPDWSLKAEPVPYARLDNPQTLNLYAYVGNNPLTHTDVDGHQGAPAETSDPKCNPSGGGKCPNQVTADKIEAISAANAQAAQQNSTATTPGDPSRLTQPNPDTVVPGSPTQQRDRVYQLTDKDGNAISTPGAQIMENAKVTKQTPGYQVGATTSNGEWRSENPGPGQFTDRLGPSGLDKTATYSYTTRQTFQVKIGDTTYPLTTVIRNQITVVNGVVSPIKTTVITP